MTSFVEKKKKANNNNNKTEEEKRGFFLPENQWIKRKLAFFCFFGQ